MTEPTEPSPEPAATDARPARPLRRRLFAAAAAAVLVVGAGGLLIAGHDDTSVLTPIAPTAINKLRTSGAVAVKGAVAEIFGGKFIVQDVSGRALVDTGPEGDGRQIVAKGETVAVQGRFENDELHAAMVTGPDGHRIVLGPLAPPPGPLERAKERIGLWPKPDLGALTGLVQSAGYSDVRVVGRGPRHLDVVAKGPDGTDRDLHVDFDGRIRERGSL